MLQCTEIFLVEFHLATAENDLSKDNILMIPAMLTNARDERKGVPTQARGDQAARALAAALRRNALSRVAAQLVAPRLFVKSGKVNFLVLETFWGRKIYLHGGR